MLPVLSVAGAAANARNRFGLLLLYASNQHLHFGDCFSLMHQ